MFLFVLNKVQRPRHNFFNPPFSVSLHGRGTCVTFESEICEWRSSLEKPPIYRNTTAELGPLIFPVMETSQKKRNICFIALNAVSVLLSPPASTHWAASILNNHPDWCGPLCHKLPIFSVCRINYQSGGSSKVWYQRALFGRRVGGVGLAGH